MDTDRQKDNNACGPRYKLDMGLGKVANAMELS